VGELETEYEGRIDFVIISAEETKQRGDEIALYGFTDLKHGMVGFTGDGETLVKMPGHSFDKAEITAAAEQLLAADA